MNEIQHHGRRLLPNIIAHESYHNPDRLYAVIANSNDPQDGFTEVNFSMIAYAASYTARWLEAEIDLPRAHHETLTYIGVPDLRYIIVFYAALKLRYKLFLPSPRNPPSVNCSLLEQTESSKLVFSAELATVARSLQTAQPGLKTKQLPPLAEILAASSKNAEPYVFDSTFEEAHEEPILILHSSGSTGLPKPIVMTHGTFAIYDNRNFPTVDGRKNYDVTILDFPNKGSLYEILPPFHIAGFIFKAVVPVYNRTSVVFGPPLAPPSGKLVAQVMRSLDIVASILPPSIAEQLYHETGGVELLKKLELLIYAGGPLAQTIGDELVKHTTLCQFYGSTEMGGVRQLFPHRENWAYLEFHPKAKQELQQVEAGLYELVLFADDSTKDTSSLNHNFPGLHEWRTKDLFERHPTKPNLWKFHARRDDILVFSNGEKLNPIPMESIMTTHPGISGALVVGQGNSRASLLLEIRSTFDFGADPVNTLWPEVEKANMLVPGYGRVSKSMMIIASSNKPFVRAGKGTIVRRLTERLYADEIKQLYQSIFKALDSTGKFILEATFQIDAVVKLLKEILEEVGLDPELDTGANFYIHGMDSIKTTEAVNHLKSSLSMYKTLDKLTWLGPETLYYNPTIEKLANIILAFMNNNETPRARNRQSEIKATIDRYIQTLPTNVTPKKHAFAANELHVAVTGTTGFLGRRLLLKLIADESVSVIYCLNRSSTAEEQWQRWSKRPTDKLRFMRIDLPSPKLGLRESDYGELVRNCDVIVHNAWPVNFNLPLSSFTDSLEGVTNIVSLCSESSKQLNLVFVSSISATGVWGSPSTDGTEVPEYLVTNITAPMEIGYAESKAVSEHILSAACSKSGLNTSILRVGLICPSTEKDDADWPDLDVLHVLFETSRRLKMVPSDMCPIDWVPVNHVASIIHDVVKRDAKSAPTSEARFYNLVNPKPVAWSKAIDAFQSLFGANIPALPMKAWIEKVQQSADDATIQQQVPAFRMLRVFELISERGPMHNYHTQNLEAVSEAMAQLPSVDVETLSMWLRNTGE